MDGMVAEDVESNAARRSIARQQPLTLSRTVGTARRGGRSRIAMTRFISKVPSLIRVYEVLPPRTLVDVAGKLEDRRGCAGRHGPSPRQPDAGNLGSPEEVPVLIDLEVFIPANRLQDVANVLRSSYKRTRTRQCHRCVDTRHEECEARHLTN